MLKIIFFGWLLHYKMMILPKIFFNNDLLPFKEQCVYEHIYTCVCEKSGDRHLCHFRSYLNAILFKHLFSLVILYSVVIFL